MSVVRLKRRYNLYYVSGIENRKNMSKEDFESQMKLVTHFDTIDEFWRTFLHLKLPSELQLKSKLIVFKDKIDPLWEHPQNKFGGSIYIDFKVSEETDEAWQGLVLEFLTCFSNDPYFDNFINGIEVRRQTIDSVSMILWTVDCEAKDIKSLFGILKNYVPFPPSTNYTFREHKRSINVGVHNKDNSQYPKQKYDNQF